MTDQLTPSLGLKDRILAGVAVVPNAGRIALSIGAVSAVFSLTQMIAQWHRYSLPWVAAVAWLVQVCVLIAVVATGTRHAGTLPVPVLALSVVLLYAVDVAVVSQLPSELWYSPASWNWGAVAIALVAISPYRPSWEVVAAAAGHAAIGVVTLGLAASAMRLDKVALVLLVSGCLIPVLSAAHYLRLYTAVLEVRREIAIRRLSAEAQQSAEAAIRTDSESRLIRLRAQVVPLLSEVGQGAALPLDMTTTARARTLMEALRRELVESSTGGWLLQAHIGSNEVEVPVEVVGALAGLGQGGGADVAALIDLLRRFPEWTTLRVTVADSDPVAVVVVAQGASAQEASADLSVQAAAAALGGEVRVVGPGVLLVEGRVPRQ
ncbi:hypothetical protein ACWEIJ_44540 [Lentzea sp. NPDC004789]